MLLCILRDNFTPVSCIIDVGLLLIVGLNAFMTNICTQMELKLQTQRLVNRWSFIDSKLILKLERLYDKHFA